MSVELLDPRRLTVVLDVRHPFAYLALHPTLAFAERLAVDVDWVPTSVPALNPPSAPRSDDTRGDRHRRSRMQAIEREIDIYAAAQGLTLRDFYRDGGADAANRAWLWVRAHHPSALPAFLTELFRQYWSLELDASNVEQVARLLESADLDVAAFTRWASTEAPAVLDAMAEVVRERGVFQTPGYLVGNEVFHGRQHLPMIEWILAGSTGPIPI